MSDDSIIDQSDSSMPDPQDEHDVLIKNAKILMVDDEPINMEVLQLHLEAEGYSEFVATSDSTQAYAVIVEHQPDIVLLDLMMPDVDGFAILERLRANEDTRHLSVIVLTSSNDSATKLKALRMGANDFLAKPVDASELALRLRNTLSAQFYQTQLANFDSLTGLPNRKKFLSDLEKIHSDLRADRRIAGLLLINIDRFKAVNDAVGRSGGDELLLLISRRLALCFGEGGTNVKRTSSSTFHRVYRVSGDKFAVLLASAETPRDVQQAVNPFLELMREPVRCRGTEIVLQCSLGSVLFPFDGQDVRQVYANVETAMFQARQSDTHSYAHFSAQMDEQAKRLSTIENGLRTAVNNGELFLLLQPKVSVLRGNITGAEALLRWQHPELGLIPPDEFIATAEDSGLIVPIGKWVLEEACRLATEIRRAGFPEFKVAVNVSIRQLSEDNFTDIIQQTLNQAGLPANGLKLELTENMIMENAEENVVKLRALKDVGIAISIDDFGTGYSSLSYLQKFPLDELKIDQSFIKTIRTPLEPAPIVKAVVSLAHELGMTLVAEGVESHHQLARLKALRCEEYQGYLCSKPVNKETLLQLLISSHQKAA